MVRVSKIDNARIAAQSHLAKGTLGLQPREAVFESSPFALSLGCRIGFGNDVHRLVIRRKLILGGVRIPFGRGPMSHSDGDALSHAICDALLGAAALGDIGRHFPDSSPRWKGVSSLMFLRQVSGLVSESGFVILNVDSTIEMEKPRLAAYIDRMRRNLARALGVRVEQVSVKAKSGEGIGEVGRSEAVRAEAVALIGTRRRA
ncbi:MAG TPA: 2-C-methyl-D-erythritol 2,4-cyclodiphosphate synthase [Terriglobia bacterium]|nr:2-C-methyl-D-erythritol 2,4-cyclodiphosphate synthase [Terriglobia bacterium]